MAVTKLVQGKFPRSENSTGHQGERSHRLRPWTFCIPALIWLMLLTACASTNEAIDKKTGMGIPRDIQIPKEAAKLEVQPPREEVKTPDFEPARDEMSPLKSRIVDIAARNTPLRDVLFIIAEATNLNLVMEKDVDPDVPVTITLRRVSAEDALNNVFSIVDYFYSIKNNMLLVKAIDTRTFELGHPAVTQTYNTDLGGDMLGSSATGNMPGMSGGGTSNIKGSVTQKSESDKTAYNFWDVIEKTIEKLLASSATTGHPGIQAPAPPPGVQAAPAAPYRSAAHQSFAINRMTGTIIVTASKKNIEKVEQYLDVVRKVINRQVLVEAKIIEVRLSDGFKMGIDWSLLSTLNQRQTVDIGVQNFAIPAVSATSSAFTIATTAADFTSLLKAIQTQGEARLLSNPRVSIMNGQTSILGVGQSQSFISKVSSTVSTTGLTPITTYTVDTSSTLSGIMIGIVPFVNERGEISLTITPIISSLKELTPKTIGGGVSGSVELMLPTVDLREMSTTVKVQNGQIIIIGGLISNVEEVQDSQVPFLGKIPVLGYLFKSRIKSYVKTELVIMIQPFIISR